MKATTSKYPRSKVTVVKPISDSKGKREQRAARDRHGFSECSNCTWLLGAFGARRAG